MKTFLFPLVFTLFSVVNSYGQWLIQSTPTTNLLRKICIIDSNNCWAVGYGGTILHTTNGGTNWNLENSNTTEDLFSIRFPANNTGFAFGNNGTFLKYAGGQWTGQSSGTNDNLYTSHFMDENTGWAAGFHETVIKTTDGGNSWQSQLLVHDNAVASIYFINPDVGWAVTEYVFSDNNRYGILFKTTDGGNTWAQKFSVGHGVLYPGYLFVSVFFINQNTGWIAGSNGLVYRTDDGGNTWNYQFAPTDEWLYSIYFIDQNQGWVVGNHGAIFKTTNGGYSWNQNYSGVSDWLFSVKFLDQNTGWAAGDNGRILKTTNGGGIPVELVSFRGEGLKNDVVLSWITASELNNRGFEIERKSNAGFEKIAFVAGNGNSTEIRTYTFTDRNLLNGKYVYRLKQIDYDGSFRYSDEVKIEINNPVEYALMQNYPNPFNPATNITFTIPSGTKVKLEVYNSLGQKVSSLIDGYTDAGYHSVVFDGEGLPSGIYYYRLKTNNYSEVKKLLLLK